MGATIANSTIACARFPVFLRLRKKTFIGFHFHAVLLNIVAALKKTDTLAAGRFRYCSPEATPLRVLRPDFTSGSMHPKNQIIQLCGNNE
jgi:hypothetical protein